MAHSTAVNRDWKYAYVVPALSRPVEKGKHSFRSDDLMGWNGTLDG